MEEQEVVKLSAWAQFVKRLDGVVLLTVMTLCAAIAFTVLTAKPILGFVIVGAGAIYLCYQITAGVFLFLTTILGLQAFMDARRVRKEASQEA